MARTAAASRTASHVSASVDPTSDDEATQAAEAPPISAQNGAAEADAIDPEYNGAETDEHVPAHVKLDRTNSDHTKGPVLAPGCETWHVPYTMENGDHYFRGERRWWKSTIAGGYFPQNGCDECFRRNLDCVFYCQEYLGKISWSNRCTTCWMFGKRAGSCRPMERELETQEGEQKQDSEQK